MLKASQGSVLKLSGLSVPVVVVSKDFFNSEGHVIVCPIYKKAVEGPLHIPVKYLDSEGFVMCEQPKYVDLETRRFTKLAHLDYYDIMNISDAIMGIFDYQ